MPPSSKPQPTAEEVELLRAWVAGDVVSFPATSGEAEPEAEATPQAGEAESDETTEEGVAGDAEEAASVDESPAENGVTGEEPAAEEPAVRRGP